MDGHAQTRPFDLSVKNNDNTLGLVKPWGDSKNDRLCGWVAPGFTYKIETINKTNEVKTKINHPFGCGLYLLFMVIWGMVHYCFNHIMANSHGLPWFCSKLSNC